MQPRNAQSSPPEATRPEKPIVLVGHMGSGKTSIGKRLADALGLPFRDSDEEIEKAACMTVAEIFARFGEPHFRDGERRVVARLIAEGPGVIATGGGAFVDPQTRALALASGIVIWLDADLDTLVARVRRRSSRPLLVGRDPRHVLQELAGKRNPAYAQAHFRIPCTEGPHDATVRAILRALQELA
ncbi:shikimate kinase [Thermaurantiacus sp.]